MVIDQNDQNDQESGHIEAESVSRTAGAELEAERKRQGLSEMAVSAQLHITMHYLRAIESDNYEKLPGAVFAKGYIRNYAQLLGMDEDEIVGLYRDLTQQNSLVADEQVRQGVARSKKDRNLPWLIFSIIAFITGFLGLWLYNTLFSDTENEDIGAETRDNQANIQSWEVAALQTGSTAVRASDDSRLKTIDQLAEVAEVAQVAQVAEDNIEPVEDPETSQEAGENRISSKAPLSVIVAPEQPSTATPESVPAIEHLITGIAVDELPAQTEINVRQLGDKRLIEVIARGSDQLQIIFSGDSWVEVTDAVATKIYFDMREAGDLLHIFGEAPFNILLGDATYASMQLNGKDIKVSDNIRNDKSARMTVGQ